MLDGRRKPRIDQQAFDPWPHSEDVLGHRHPVPRRGSSEPRVLRLSMAGSVTAGDRLCIYVGFGSMDLGDLLTERGGDLRPVFERLLAVPEPGFGDHHPGVGVAEDAAVLLVPGWVGADLTQLHAELGECGLNEHDAVITIEPLLHGVSCHARLSGVDTDAGHDTDAVGLDEDLTLCVGCGSDFVPEGIVCPQEPFPIPCMFQHRVGHTHRLPTSLIGLGAFADGVEEFCVEVGCMDEQACDEHRLRGAAFPVLGGLERFAGGCRECVEVQAVIPVRPTDQWQTVRPEMIQHVLVRPPQVFEQWSSVVRVVVERHLLAKDGQVTGLEDVCASSLDQPERVVVEPGTDGVVASLGERLVLVVGAAVGELRCGDIEDSLASTFRDEVDESEQVL